MSCFIDGKPCRCQAGGEDCKRDPFRGPSFREEMDEDYQVIANYSRFFNEDENIHHLAA